MADLVTIATTAALTQFVGPMFKHLGEQALERAKQIASAAVAQLKAVGREPQPVEPKLLLPLVQAASLESDPTLAEKWAALLANAADPAQRVQVQPSFTEALRQLTPVDAQVLTFIYAYRLLEDADPLTVINAHSHFEHPIEVLELSFDNLLRLRLYEALASGLYGMASPLSSNAIIMPTRFGDQFLLAVTPPTP